MNVEQLGQVVDCLLAISDEQWMLSTPCRDCNADTGQPCTSRRREFHADRRHRGHALMRGRGELRQLVSDVTSGGYSVASTVQILRGTRIYGHAIRVGYLLQP